MTETYFFTDGMPGYHATKDEGHDHDICRACAWYAEREEKNLTGAFEILREANESEER